MRFNMREQQVSLSTYDHFKLTKYDADPDKFLVDIKPYTLFTPRGLNFSHSKLEKRLQRFCAFSDNFVFKHYRQTFLRESKSGLFIVSF